MEEQAVVVLMTAPSMEAAGQLAEMLVGRRLAACVNILAGIASIYTWKGEVQREAEVLLIAKTTAARFANGFAEAVQEIHPYDVPEIIALPVTAGWPPYLAWVGESVG